MNLLPVEPRAGLIVLSTDVTPERDLVPALTRAGILTAVSKIFYRNPISRHSLRDIGEGLRASANLLPADDTLGTVAFCCTSAAIELGEERIEAAIRTVRPSSTVTSAAGAVREELLRINPKQIALFAPYQADITAGIARHFERAGFTIAATHSLGLDDDRTIATVDPAFIRDWVVRSSLGTADAILVSCTALRSLEVEAAISAAIDGRPVVTSNGALLRAIQRRIAAVNLTRSRQ